MKLQNSEFLINRLNKGIEPQLLLEILQDYYLTLGKSDSSSNYWREQYTRIVLEEECVKNLMKRGIGIDSQHQSYSKRMDKLLEKRQEIIDYNLEAIEAEAGKFIKRKMGVEIDENIKEQVKKELFKKLTICNQENLRPSKEMDECSGNIFRRSSSTEVTIYPLIKTLNEKYKALCKAFDGNMDLDSLVRFSCVNHYSLLPTVEDTRWENMKARWKALGWVCTPGDFINIYHINDYLRIILDMQKENTELEQKLHRNYKNQKNLLTTELQIELEITQINWKLTELEENLEKSYLDIKISEHEELGEFIESAKMDLHERTMDLKLQGTKTQSQYAKFEAELLKIGLDSKIAAHESLGHWIESGKMHLHEITIALKELQLEEFLADNSFALKELGLEAPLTNDACEVTGQACISEAQADSTV